MKLGSFLLVAMVLYSSVLQAADKMTVAYATLGPGLSPAG